MNPGGEILFLACLAGEKSGHGNLVHAV